MVWSLCTPSSVEAYTLSFPVMVVCVWTFVEDILGLVQYDWCTIIVVSSLFGWCCCEDGCLMWFLIRNRMLRLSVNIYKCRGGWSVSFFWKLEKKVEFGSDNILVSG